MDYTASSSQMNRYCLFKFENEQLSVVFNDIASSSHYDSTRGVYIDGYFYLIGYDNFKVYKSN